jgi:GT2 family glycosyltransferase
MREDKKVTIGMVVRNHFEQTEKAIRSLAEHTDPSKYVLYVFDNGSSEANDSFVTHFCREKGIECKYLYSTENEGYNARQNQLYDMCETEYALICHQDVVFSAYWLEDMMRRFNDPMVAAVGPVISFALGAQSVNYAYHTFNSDVKFLVGLFFLCRIDVLRMVKEKFGEGKWYVAPAYGVLGDKEELELCYRIRQLGFQLEIARDVYIEHEGEKNFVDTLGSKAEFYKYQNKQRDILVSRLGQDVVNDIYAIRITKPYKVMLGILTRTEYVHYKNVISLLKIFGNTLIQKNFSHIARGHPAEGRNQIIKEFLKTDNTHLLFIDDDMTFDQTSLNRLLARDVDIVTGLAHQRGEPYAPCVFLANPETKLVYPLEPADNSGLVEIDTMGAFFTLIKRHVLENVPGPWYKYGDTTLGYGCDDGVGADERGIGEDVYFGLKCKLAGWGVYCDTNVYVEHIGQEQMITRELAKEYRESGKQKTFLENKFKKM